MNHSHLGNASWYSVVYLITVLCSCVLAGRQCSAKDNSYWNNTAKFCDICSECQHGFARNFSEQYTGPTGRNGDEACLSCRPPPPGYYIRVFGKHPAVFQLCVVNCAHLFRFQKVACGVYSDAVCGSCIAGYGEDINNIDIACKQSPISDITKITVSTTERTAAVKNNTEVQRSHTKVPTTGLALYEVLLLTFGVTVFFAILIFIFLSLRAKWHRMAKSKISMSDPERRLTGVQKYTPISSVELSNYVTTDGHVTRGPGVSNDVTMDRPVTRGPAVYNDVTTDGPQGPNGDHCHPELDSVHPGQTVHTDPYLAVTPSPNRQTKELKICECSKRKRCKCAEIAINFQNIKMMDTRNILHLVATKFCHNPDGVFKSLKVLNPDYYQIFSDMVINPEKQGTKESHDMLLSKWVEIKAEQAMLSQLIETLCQHKFHDINEAIAQQIQQETQLKVVL